MTIRLRNAVAVLLLLAAAFVAAGGYVHLREWLQVYRDVPAAVPGAAVVRVGFPVDTVLSTALAGMIVLATLRAPRWITRVVALGIIFEAGALAALVLSRSSSLFGWMEPGWSRGAGQTRAVELGAVLLLGIVLGLRTVDRRSGGGAHRIVIA
jgi:hypothetical protein